MVAVALSETDQGIAELRAALRGATVIVIRNASELRPLLHNETGLDLLLIGPMAGASGAIMSGIREARRLYPSLAIVAYLPVTAENIALAAHLAQAGVDDVAVQGASDLPNHLGRIRRRASARRTAQVTFAAIADVVPPSASQIVACCLDLGVGALTVQALADDLGLHRRTLVKRLALAGLPTPSMLIAWARLIHAVAQLRDPGRSVEQVGLTTGFGSGTALRNMLRRHAGLRPNEIRGPDGVDLLIHVFRQSIAYPEVVLGASCKIVNNR